MNERYALTKKKPPKPFVPPPLIYVRKRDNAKYLNPRLGWEAVKEKGMGHYRDGHVKLQDIAANHVKAYVTGWSNLYITTLWFDAEHRDSNRSINWECSCLWGQHAHQLRRVHLRSRYCSHAYAVAVAFGELHGKREKVSDDNVWRVLTAVKDKYTNGTTASLLCSELGLQPEYVAQCLEMLVEHGYVESRDDLYTITTDGKNALNAAKQRDVTPEEQETITTYGRSTQRRDMVQRVFGMQHLTPHQLARVQYQLQNSGFYKNDYASDAEAEKVLLAIITDEISAYDAVPESARQQPVQPVSEDAVQVDNTDTITEQVKPKVPKRF